MFHYYNIVKQTSLYVFTDGSMVVVIQYLNDTLVNDKRATIYNRNGGPTATVQAQFCCVVHTNFHQTQISHTYK